MADELRQALGVDANLIPGSNGVFDVIVDEKPVFSKSETGRFPDPGEIVVKLKQPD